MALDADLKEALESFMASLEAAHTASREEADAFQQAFVLTESLLKEGHAAVFGFEALGRSASKRTR